MLCINTWGLEVYVFSPGLPLNFSVNLNCIIKRKTQRNKWHKEKPILPACLTGRTELLLCCSDDPEWPADLSGGDCIHFCSIDQLRKSHSLVTTAALKTGRGVPGGLLVWPPSVRLCLEPTYSIVSATPWAVYQRELLVLPHSPMDLVLKVKSLHSN